VFVKYPFKILSRAKTGNSLLGDLCRLLFRFTKQISSCQTDVHQIQFGRPVSVPVFTRGYGIDKKTRVDDRQQLWTTVTAKSQQTPDSKVSCSFQFSVLAVKYVSRLILNISAGQWHF